MYLYPLNSDFKIGDKVMDETAESNGWPDRFGEVIEVDGSQVRVRYESGNERWKMHINLRLAERYKCLACNRTWNRKELYQDPQSTAMKLTCGDLFCGGTVKIL